MSVMFKYPLYSDASMLVPSEEPADIMLPKDSIVRHFDYQYQDDTGMFCIWAEVPDDASTTPGDNVTRRFIVVPTGRHVEGEYLGSCLVGGGMLVWHLFEQPAEE